LKTINGIISMTCESNGNVISTYKVLEKYQKYPKVLRKIAQDSQKADE